MSNALLLRFLPLSNRFLLTLQTCEVLIKPNQNNIFTEVFTIEANEQAGESPKNKDPGIKNLHQGLGSRTAAQVSPTGNVLGAGRLLAPNLTLIRKRAPRKTRRTS